MNGSIRLFSILLVCATMTLLGGCGKKEVSPYSATSDTTMPEGRNFEYPQGGGEISRSEFGPSVDTLDATGGYASTGSGDYGMAGDQGSDEYKREHGRSSPQLRPIYFDFDQAVIRMDQVAALEHNAEYMKSTPSARLIVEGNCDERGTSEYNLALGERRALIAKKYLLELGVEEYRIRTKSYGEEMPLFTGQDDFSYSRNRRDDFILE